MQPATDGHAAHARGCLRPTIGDRGAFGRASARIQGDSPQQMRSLRTWLTLAATIPAAVGLLVVGRMWFYSQVPVHEDRVAYALRVLAYNRISCPEASLSDYSEGSTTLQCRDQEATRYHVFSIEPCSETLGCRWFQVLCSYVSKLTPDPPI
jgi:hypothetical protein